MPSEGLRNTSKLNWEQKRGKAWTVGKTSRVALLDWNLSEKFPPLTNPRRRGRRKAMAPPLGGSRYLISGSLDINKREILTQAFGLLRLMGDTADFCSRSLRNGNRVAANSWYWANISSANS